MVLPLVVTMDWVVNDDALVGGGPAGLNGNVGTEVIPEGMLTETVVADVVVTEAVVETVTIEETVEGEAAVVAATDVVAGVGGDGDGDTVDFATAGEVGTNQDKWKQTQRMRFF